jgi:hypothetical protein
MCKLNGKFQGMDEVQDMGEIWGRGKVKGMSE